MFVFYFNLCILDFQLAIVVVIFWWFFFDFFDFFRFFWIFLPFSLTEFNGQQIKINEQNLTDRMASVSGHLYFHLRLRHDLVTRNYRVQAILQSDLQQGTAYRICSVSLREAGSPCHHQRAVL